MPWDAGSVGGRRLGFDGSFWLKRRSLERPSRLDSVAPAGNNVGRGSACSQTVGAGRKAARPVRERRQRTVAADRERRDTMRGSRKRVEEFAVARDRHLRRRAAGADVPRHTVGIEARQRAIVDGVAGDRTARRIGRVGKTTAVGDRDPARRSLGRRDRRADHGPCVPGRGIGRDCTCVGGAAEGFGDDQNSIIGEREAKRGHSGGRRNGRTVRHAVRVDRIGAQPVGVLFRHDELRARRIERHLSRARGIRAQWTGRAGNRGQIAL